MRKLLSLSILFLILFLTGCTSQNIESTRSYYQYFDTTIDITVWDNKEYPGNSKFWDEVEDILIHVQNTFQRDAPSSELYQLNLSAGSGDAAKVSDDLYEVIKLGIEYAEKTDGRFDPTVGPLVDLWDINNPVDSHPAPPDEEIKNLLPLVNYTLIELNDEEKLVKLPEEGMIIDLGAIAKGYAADILGEHFKEKGIKHALVYLGGNILVVGERHSKRADGTLNWSIGIDPKLGKGYIGSVYIVDKTVVTSGIYERYIIDDKGTEDTADDKMYHHIIDTSTGYSVENNLASVSIITDSSATADALSTSLFALGLEAGLEFIEGYENVEAVFVTKDNEIYKTSGIDTLYNFKNRN